METPELTEEVVFGLCVIARGYTDTGGGGRRVATECRDRAAVKAALGWVDQVWEQTWRRKAVCSEGA